jgi:hypothetical protein
MALRLLTTSAFERDLRRVRRQSKNLDKLEAVVGGREPLWVDGPKIREVSGFPS